MNLSTSTYYINTADLKKNIDIVSVIGDVVNLVRKGSNCWGICPFHNERTASFSVSDKQFFYCFGCHQTGDVIDFVKAYYHLNFIEAYDWLANKYGTVRDINPEIGIMSQKSAQERQTINNLAGKIIKVIDDKIKNLIREEKLMLAVLNSIRTERVLEIPFVVEIIKKQPMLTYYLDKIYSSNTLVEKMQMVLEAERFVIRHESAI